MVEALIMVGLVVLLGVQVHLVYKGLEEVAKETIEREEKERVRNK